MSKIDNEIKALKYRWKSWAKKRCEGLDNQDLKNEYYSFAARVCLESIKQLLKNKDKKNKQ